jgi:uncharacterized protein YgbK (DUF1537 family)
MTTTKIIALDDDPTGSQTVHSCLLLTRWDVATLKEGLLDDSPLFFVLTNTRGMDAERAATITREVCVNLKQALAELAADGTTINPVMVSRSDSTLRGHYPVETDIIAEELGPFDAHFMVPAFFEGGRITRDSVHYLMVDGEPVAVHETEFAKDSVFGYQHSYLPDYVEEKTNGRIPADQVERFVLDDVRGDSLSRLMALQDNTCCPLMRRLRQTLTTSVRSSWRRQERANVSCSAVRPACSLRWHNCRRSRWRRSLCRPTYVTAVPVPWWLALM